MNITILCVGKLKEKYWNDSTAEYVKRLSKYCKLSINELKEEMAPEKCSDAEKTAILKAEGDRILKALKPTAYAVALCIQGRQLSSEQLAEQLAELALTGKSDVAFIIGGSFGLSAEVQSRADFHLSFSKMTFPHQMMRLILLEQIYRGFKINRNEAYHK